MFIKKFFRDSIIYTIPILFSRGIGLILIPLYAKVLNPADFGSFDLFTAFVSLVNLTVALEVSQGVARFYSEKQVLKRKVIYVSSAFWFTLSCYSIFSIAILIFYSKLSEVVLGQKGLEVTF